MTTSVTPRIVLALGGVRSGKSDFAKNLADREFARPLYLATAETLDKEMADRVARHRQTRGPRWTTIEAPLEAAGAIESGAPECDGILMDCATLWLTNVLLKEGVGAWERRRDELVRALRRTTRRIVIVSNEVGMGIVPESELGRMFRDYAGWLNQALAAEADAVVMLVAGLPLTLKGNLPTNRSNNEIAARAEAGSTPGA